MRLKICFTGSSNPVRLDNQGIVNSYIHNCIGRNNKYHDSKSDYSVSMLRGGELSSDKKSFVYPNGAYIVVTSANAEFMNTLLIGIMNNPVFNDEMKFHYIEHINEELVDGWNNFNTLSPFIIKKYVDKKNYTFAKITDTDFIDVVTKHIINKASKVLPNVDTSNLKVVINEHQTNKVKKVVIHDVVNLANRCNISVYCNKEVAEMLYNTGLGQSCGSGFGCLCKTENLKLYTGLKK